MSLYTYKNNVRSTLSVALSSSGTSMTLAKPVGMFVAPPVPAAGHVATLTLIPALATDTSATEIVQYTGVITNGDGTVTVTGLARGAEGTTAAVWPIGAKVFQSITAAMMNAHGTAAQADTGIGANDVPTVAQADARYAQRASNLSDLGDAPTARGNLGLGALATMDQVSSNEFTGALPVAKGGTGGTSQASARSGLGLSTVAATGKYGDLDDLPTLGTAAAHADTDFVGVGQKGTANGVTPLDGSGKVATAYMPVSVLGQVSYQGLWDASTGTAPTASPGKGWYYIASTSGSTNLSGITDWKVGDWAIYSGTAWNKVDNTDAVASVAGLVGSISTASLSQALGLGTSALTDSAAYATAAQGSLAQSAVQPNTSPSLTGADINGEVWVRGVSQTTSFDRRQGFGGLLRADGGRVSTGSGGGISMEAFGHSIAVLKGYVTNGNGTGGAMMFVATGSLATNPVMVASQQWWYDGTSKCFGAFSAPSVTDTSDARLKTNIRRDPNRYRGIRRVVEMVLYDRTSGMSDNEPGVIAQELQKAGCHADDFVGTQNDGTLTVHYGKLALACVLDPEGRE